MKTEQVFDLPPMLHKDDVSDQLFAEFEAFVGGVTTQKYVFLAKTESIVIEEASYEKNSLPPNIDVVYIKIEGQHAFVEIKIRSRFKNLGEIRDRSLNSITIQGPNPVAVRGLRYKVDLVLKPHRFLIRTIFYRAPLTWFWSTLILLWFAEYRLGQFMHASSTLSGLGAILLLSVALGTALVYANCVLAMFNYWFPYFEIENNLSSHRVSGQKFVGAVWASIVAAGIWNLCSLLLRSGK